jgi:SH3-like domain-containing protein
MATSFDRIDTAGVGGKQALRHFPPVRNIARSLLKNLFSICLLLAVTALASVMPVAADPIRQDAEHCVVNTTRDDPLNVRSGPASTARALAELPYSTCGVIVTGACRKVWCPIEDGHVVGWVHRHYIAAVSQVAYCLAPERRLALRAWPSSSSRILTKPSAESVCELTVLPYSVDGWRKVRAAGWEGWVQDAAIAR